MKYPKRPDSHAIEAKSWSILQEVAPEEWILRDVSERDYGIDAYIELVSENGDVTGQLMSIQLKGMKKIVWKPAENGAAMARSPSVKTTTAAYWLGLPVPVFLFVAELSTRNVYFVPVQEGIRNRFDKLDNQDSISFNLADIFDLKSKDGLRLLRWAYARERLHEQFAFHITNLISQIDVYGEFIRMNQNRDIFLEVEAERHLQFRALHEACRMASFYLDHEWSVESLRTLYEMDRREWQDEYTYLHEKTLDHALQKIETVFPVLVRKALALVAERRASYWRHRDPVFFSLCRSDELEWRLKQFEAEAVW